MSRAAYEIRISGNVPQRLFEDFDGVAVLADPAGSTLRADLTDQAELHGLLEALRRDGVVLVDVRREPLDDLPERACESEHTERSPGPTP